MNARSATDARWELRPFLWHGLITLALSLFVTVGLSLASSVRWDAQLVYSLSISLAIWLQIELGRFWLGRRSDRPWPHGPIGVLHLLASIALGYVLGTIVGDAYSGYSTWELLSFAPGRFVSYIVLTVAMSGAVSLYFFVLSRDQQRIEQIALAQRDAAQARLSLLQSQLEPHMLFNTLASLRLLIPQEPARAVQMLDHLNGFLRSTLSASRVSSHPLSEEFARLRDYLELMSVRMGPRLRYALNLPTALAALPIPPLLLQPLVENCIRHGLEPKVSGGTVRVTAQRQPQGLLIEIHDDGLGIAMTSPALSGPIPAGGGDSSAFGLQQVAARLRTSFGAAASLRVAPASDGGTSVWVRLPLAAAAGNDDLRPTEHRETIK